MMPFHSAFSDSLEAPFATTFDPSHLWPRFDNSASSSYLVYGFGFSDARRVPKVMVSALEGLMYWLRPARDLDGLTRCQNLRYRGRMTDRQAAQIPMDGSMEDQRPT